MDNSRVKRFCSLALPCNSIASHFSRNHTSVRYYCHYRFQQISPETKRSLPKRWVFPAIRSTFVEYVGIFFLCVVTRFNNAQQTRKQEKNKWLWPAYPVKRRAALTDFSGKTLVSDPGSGSTPFVDGRIIFKVARRPSKSDSQSRERESVRLWSRRWHRGRGNLILFVTARSDTATVENRRKEIMGIQISKSWLITRLSSDQRAIVSKVLAYFAAAPLSRPPTSTMTGHPLLPLLSHFSRSPRVHYT